MSVNKIVGIEGNTSIKEWLSGRLPYGWSVLWMENIDDLLQHGDADLYMDMAFTPDKTRIQQLSTLQAPVMINAVVPTLKDIGEPFIRINAWPGMLERNIHELSVIEPVGEKLISFLDRLYKSLNGQYRLVPDIPGMVTGRILATIISEAYYTLQDEVSTREEIDTAMKLGTNYPYGPFEWSEHIGLENIYDLLNKLSSLDSRYQPAPAMKEALQY